MTELKLEYNIVLIGFMGAGKSTVAEHMQKAYGMDMVEMDQMIAEREGMSIQDIFSEKGEDYFRNLETEILKEMQSRKNTVISCGGGAAMREENVVEMRRNGRIVLLTAEPETVYERVKNSDDRPVLAGNKNVAYIAKLLRERSEKYRAAAELTISTDGKTISSICQEMVEKLTGEEAYVV